MKIVSRLQQIIQLKLFGLVVSDSMTFLKMNECFELHFVKYEKIV